jgi:surface antigen
MMERTGKRLSPRGNAGTWYAAVPASSKSTTPKADSVAVWAGPSGSVGHVAYVESIAVDGAGTTWITFTEANFDCLVKSNNWGGGYDRAPKTLTLAKFKAHYAGFLGVIF